MKVVRRVAGAVMLGSLTAGAVGTTTVSPAFADATHKVYHHRHASRGHARHYVERDVGEPAVGGPIISGPLAAGLLNLGISGATAADGYGYGGYQRRQDYPAGYGYYGRGYLGPSYSYTGY